jgi:cobalt-zinc-cadmium efflux system membrane fusion protein
MPHSEAKPVLRYIRKVAATRALLDWGDPELLESFLSRHDETAFEALLSRHGPMVLGLCLRILHNEQDAEDAFQATFLVFSRKAASLRPQKSLAGWLYRVAYRTAQKARLDGALRRKHEGRTAVALGADPLAQLTVQEAHEVLDRELNRLPDKFRVPLVLCYLEGLTRDEAAHRLGWPVSLLKSRLEQARERLRGRLTSRGLTLTGIFVASVFHEGTVSAAVPSILLFSTAKAALAVAGGGAAVSLVPSRVVALAEGVVKAMFLTKLKSAALAFLVLAVVSLGAGVFTQGVSAGKPPDESMASLEPDRRDTIRLPLQMHTKLGIQAAEVKARAAPQPRVLRLVGTLALDPNQIWSVQGRFAPFEVLEIGKRDVQGRKEGALRMGDKVGKGEALAIVNWLADRNTDLRTGDTVRKGQVLAVVTSAGVSQKKHDLFSALVQLKLDEEILKRAEGAAESVTEVFLLTARRNVEADHNAVARALNSLKVWRIPEDEIAAVRQEAHDAAGKRKPDTEEMRKARLERWAKVTLRSPCDGTIVERNISRHEVVADGTVKLFRIANLDRLLVLANVSEEDLPSLQALTTSERRWTIAAVQPDPDRLRRHGIIDEIGYIIDPKQHTATVKGHIDNKKHQLRPGQFITASVVLPPRVAEMVLPSSALVEEGGRTFVFVQSDAKKGLYEQRRVLVVRRGKDTVHVRARLTPEQQRKRFQTIRAGEQVITTGVLELKAILDDLKAARER